VSAVLDRKRAVSAQEVVEALLLELDGFREGGPPVKASGDAVAVPSPSIVSR
jgi:hypothetical protein